VLEILEGMQVLAFTFFEANHAAAFCSCTLTWWFKMLIVPSRRGEVLQKEVRKRNQKTSHFQLK